LLAEEQPEGDRQQLRQPVGAEHGQRQQADDERLGPRPPEDEERPRREQQQQRRQRPPPPGRLNAKQLPRPA
jgi:hypothetical protein